MGVAFDHVTKYQQARAGAASALDELKAVLSRNDVAESARARAQLLLRRYSKKLDEMERLFQETLQRLTD